MYAIFHCQVKELSSSLEQTSPESTRTDLFNFFVLLVKWERQEQRVHEQVLKPTLHIKPQVSKAVHNNTISD